MKELLYKKSEAVAALNRVDGFHPMELARKIGEEGQEEQLYLDRYYDEANDSFGALTSCPEWLMTIKDNKLKKLCELPDGLNISSFLLTDRGIICVSCAGAAVYRLSENGKYEETITYIDGLEDEEIPQISINEKEEYFIVMPNARKIFKCFKGEN